MRADPVDDQAKEGEAEFPLQLGVQSEAWAWCSHAYSIFPPAFSILPRAEAESAMPLTV